MTKLFYIFLILFSFNYSYSIEAILLDDNIKSTNLGTKLELLVDETANLQIKDVKSPSFNTKFKQSTNTTPAFGFTKNAVWTRFKIRPIVFQKEDWIIEFSMPLLDYIDYYIYKEDKLIKEIHTGYLRPFESREIPNRKFLFPLNFSDNKDVTIYMRFASGDRVEIPLKLSSSSTFQKNEHIGDVLLGIFYGICFALLLNNTFLYFSTKDKGLFKYLFVVLFLVLFQATEDGIIHMYFWPFKSISLKHYILILNSTIIVVTIEFTKEYLNTKNLNKIMHYALNIFASLLILNVLSRTFLDYYITTKNLTFLAACGMSTCLLTSLVLMKKNFRPSLFYFVAFSESLVGGMVFTLKAGAVIPTNIFTTYSIQIGTAFTIILLGMALGDKINTTKRLAEKAQKEAIDNLNNLNRLKDKFVSQLEKEVDARTLEIKKEKDRADKANKAKSEFLANMSHEMRTPLNCIIGFGEFIIDNNKLQTHRSYASLIINESERLMELINQLLDITKIEAGKLKLDKYDSNLTRVIKNIIRSLEIRAKSKGIKIKSNIDKTLPEKFYIDAIRMRQILINLIGNAIKFTDEGTVNINIKVLSKNKNKTNVRFEIIDTGIGIPFEKQDSIFNSFEQADLEITRKYGGTGLGTTISKELLELMGGQLKLESTPGKGSNFWFDLEIENPTNRHPRTPIHDTGNIDKKDLPELKILIAEDYEPNREVLNIHFLKSPINYTFAINGKEAVDKASKEFYDLILMDIRMPIMDGVEATKEIRKIKSCKKTKIIGLTANAFKEEITKYLEAGMNDVIVKPVRKKILYSKLCEWNERGYEEKIENKELTLNKEKTKSKNIIIDIEKFIEEIDNNKETALEIVRNFLENIESDINLINNSISEKDAIMVHRIAHSIKGGAMNIMAPKLEKAAMELEKQAKNKNLENAKKLNDKIFKEYKNLNHFMTINYS